MYAIGNSLYVLIPKDVRNKAEITEETVCRLSYDPKTNKIEITFPEDT